MPNAVRLDPLTPSPSGSHVYPPHCNFSRAVTNISPSLMRLASVVVAMELRASLLRFFPSQIVTLSSSFNLLIGGNPVVATSKEVPSTRASKIPHRGREAPASTAPTVGATCRQAIRSLPACRRHATMEGAFNAHLVDRCNRSSCRYDNFRHRSRRGDDDDM